MAAAPTVTGRDHFTTLSGLRAHYVVWGDPARPAIVMLHGLRSYARTFDSLAGRLAGRYHLLAADARGRGDSDWDPQGQYDTESYVADLEEFADRLGLVRFILLGRSMGGATACVYAARHPERVIAAVIEDIGPGSSLSGGPSASNGKWPAPRPASPASMPPAPTGAASARTSRARPSNPGCGTPWPKTARAAGAGNSTWRASPPPASTRIRPARWICGRTSRP
jgi:esterase